MKNEGKYLCNCTKSFLSIFLFVILIIACHNEAEKIQSVKPSIIAQLDTNQYTMITWKDTLFNFGTVKEGDTVRLHFSFVNTGNKLLFINQVRPSCGCTIVDFPETPIKPGDEGDIVAIFLTKWHPGIQKKSMLVKANTKDKVNHKLFFSGKVLSNLTIQ